MEALENGAAVNEVGGRVGDTCTAAEHGHAGGTFLAGHPCYCHASSRVGRPHQGHQEGHA